jgi:hypothetical protein
MLQPVDQWSGCCRASSMTPADRDAAALGAARSWEYVQTATALRHARIRRIAHDLGMKVVVVIGGLSYGRALPHVLMAQRTSFKTGA